VRKISQSFTPSYLELHVDELYDITYLFCILFQYSFIRG